MPEDDATLAELLADVLLAIPCENVMTALLCVIYDLELEQLQAAA